eukprot:TRINITY_DN3178_c0_g1_i2.p1 TRINITY_DN3178_c0_g1~~TRINITY_DN3178_c0_g1_i2.p1  ORF type:complete len:230 (+),score=39.03 TRINITY_DN3178_c0_g1_i2:161-850(+)
MAFGIHKKSKLLTIMVYDFGGGTLDVSILTVTGGVFEVIGISGDEHLGGEDFTDNILKHYLSDTYSSKYKHEFTEREFIQVLRQHVERTKIELSTQLNSSIDFDYSFTDGYKIHFSETLNRDEFVRINEYLFESSLYPVQQALKDSSMEKEDIDQIVIVGGASRMPQVSILLQKFFGKQPNNEVDPQQAVAIGTALQAAICADLWPLQVAAREKPKYNITKSITYRKFT